MIIAKKVLECDDNYIHSKSEDLGDKELIDSSVEKKFKWKREFDKGVEDLM